MDELAAFAATARKVKELVAPADLQTLVQVWKNQELLITVTLPGDRMRLLNVLSMVIPGLSADKIAASFESYGTELTHNPRTGEGWKHGEMQEMAESDPSALSKGIISAAIITMVYPREGKPSFIQERYRMAGNTVIWSTKEVVTESVPAGGDLHNVVIELFNRPTMASELEKVNEEMVAQFGEASRASPLRVAVTAEVAVYRRLLELGYAQVGLYVEPGTERERELRRAMEALGMKLEASSPPKEDL